MWFPRLQIVYVWVERGRKRPMQYMCRVYPKDINAMCPPIKVFPMPDGTHSPK